MAGIEKEYAQASKTGEQRGTVLSWANRKIASLIDKLNMLGYNIPVVYTGGILEDGNGTSGNPKEDS